jgi:hypothetical protein
VSISCNAIHFVGSCIQPMGQNSNSIWFYSFSSPNELIIYNFTIPMLIFLPYILVLAGHFVSYTFPNTNARCWPTCMRVSSLSPFLEIFLIMDYIIRSLHPGMYTAKKNRPKLVEGYSKPK